MRAFKNTRYSQNISAFIVAPKRQIHTRHANNPVPHTYISTHAHIRTCKLLRYFFATCSIHQATTRLALLCISSNSTSSFFRHSCGRGFPARLTLQRTPVLVQQEQQHTAAAARAGDAPFGACARRARISAGHDNTGAHARMSPGYVVVEYARCDCEIIAVA